jgi:hypothetical protein
MPDFSSTASASSKKRKRPNEKDAKTGCQVAAAMRLRCPWLCNCRVPSIEPRKGNPHHKKECKVACWNKAVLEARDNPLIEIPKPTEDQIVKYISEAKGEKYCMSYKAGVWHEIPI